jgi:predicted nucleic acid-binding protein
VREGVVVDASAAVRGLTAYGSAAGVLDQIGAGTLVGHSPDLLVAEVSNALALAVRTERRSLDDAQAVLGSLLQGPIELHPTVAIAPAAMELAATTRLSAYDSFYAVLARALGMPLVTADRRLAEAVPESMLVA